MKAITRRLDSDVDLVSAGDLLFERNRLGLAGRGVALRVRLPDAEDALAAIDVDDEVGLPGCGPVAFGALPFDPDAPAELIVPAEVFGRADDGTRWHTVIGERGELEAIGAGNRP
ncbi:MAG: menaquinone-specific isochorismate synthase, partial [Acidimicrobiaceae bacterium]